MKRKLIYIAMALTAFSAALVIAGAPGLPAPSAAPKNPGHGKHLTGAGNHGTGNLNKRKTGAGQGHSGQPSTPTPTPTPVPSVTPAQSPTLGT